MRAWDFIANIVQCAIVADAALENADPDEDPGPNMHIDLLSNHVLDFLEASAHEQAHREKLVTHSDKDEMKARRRQVTNFKQLRSQQHRASPGLSILGPRLRLIPTTGRILASMEF